MGKGLSDIEQDLIIEQVRTSELSLRLKERDNRVVELSYALRLREKELSKTRTKSAACFADMKTLCAELMQLCSVSPVNEAEIRRRTLAMTEIITAACAVSGEKC